MKLIGVEAAGCKRALGKLDEGAWCVGESDEPGCVTNRWIYHHTPHGWLLIESQREVLIRDEVGKTDEDGDPLMHVHASHVSVPWAAYEHLYLLSEDEAQALVMTLSLMSADDAYAWFEHPDDVASIIKYEEAP